MRLLFLLQKYFVDKVLNKNCFVLFARELHIEWSDHQEYWQWNQDKDIRSVNSLRTTYNDNV